MIFPHGGMREKREEPLAEVVGAPSSLPHPHSPEGIQQFNQLMLFFALVYIVEGLGQARVGVIAQPLNHYLKQAGWTPVEVTAYLAVLNFPWIIKPVFGLVSDLVPLFGSRRKSYLVLANFGAIAAYAWITRLTAPSDLAAFLLLTSYAMAVSSTLCGALLVENGQRFHSSGLFIGQQWLWFYIAIMASSLIGGQLVEKLPATSALHSAAAIAAVAPIAVILGCLLLVHEKKSSASLPELKRTFQSILVALRSKRLHLVALFLFLYSFSPGFGTPLYYFMTDRLQFSQSYIGLLGSIASAGWIAGAVLHRWLLWRLSSKALLNLSIPLATMTTASFLLLRDEMSAAAVNFLNGISMMIATISALTLAADYCPKRSEGFAFAVLMSVMNLADPLSNNIGALLYEHVFHAQLDPLILVSAASTGFALVLVPLLRLGDRPQGEPL